MASNFACPPSYMNCFTLDHKQDYPLSCYRVESFVLQQKFQLHGIVRSLSRVGQNAAC